MTAPKYEPFDRLYRRLLSWEEELEKHRQFAHLAPKAITGIREQIARLHPEAKLHQNPLSTADGNGT